MPVISRFFGIVVRMYYRDHAPPHFHARYGEHEVVVQIDGLRVLGGGLPLRAYRMLIEWAALHGQELAEDWRLARAGEPLRPIAPLE
ncbi:MAG: DUF4160 domain-containing protein [Planctomycetota bacterium]